MKLTKIVLGCLSVGMVMLHLSKIDGSMELQLANPEFDRSPGSVSDQSIDSVEEIELLPPSFLGMCQLLKENAERFVHIEALSNKDFECFDLKMRSDVTYVQGVLRECQQLSPDQKRILRIHLFNLHCVYHNRMFMKEWSEGNVEMQSVANLYKTLLTTRLMAVVDIIDNGFKSIEVKRIFKAMQRIDTHEKIAFINNVQDKPTEIDEKDMQAIEAQFQAFCSKPNLDANEMNDLELMKLIQSAWFPLLSDEHTNL
jgi:hypothetical protein